MPVRSPHHTISIPHVDIWEFVFERKDRPYPEDKVIFEDVRTKRSHTFRDVKNAARVFGQGLKSTWNWKKGDALVIFSANCVDTPCVIWGTLWTGGVVCPASPASTADELAHQLQNVGASAIVAEASTVSVALAAAKMIGLSADRILLMGDERDPDARILHYTSIRTTSRQVISRVKLDPKKDLAFLVYSSGTTGLPKSVMISHFNIVSNVLQLSKTEGRHLSWTGGAENKGDKVLAFLPFYHIYGTSTEIIYEERYVMEFYRVLKLIILWIIAVGLTALIHNSIYGGYHTLVMSNFNIEHFCATIQDYKVTYCYVVPPVILLLSRHHVVDKYDLSSLRMITSAAAPLTRELIKKTSRRIKVGIKQGYGLSETSSTCYVQLWEDWEKHMGSVGKLLPNMEAKYMTCEDDSSDSVELPIGEVGELYVRGPNVFMGYLGNPKATAESIAVTGGWLRTGDIGYQDKDGNFYITDRAKELIKYKGFQVAPAELEGILLQNEAVDDVAVIGVESKEYGTEVPRAYVVLSKKTNSEICEAEEAVKIAQWMEKRVAPHKRLRGGVKFLGSIPKTASGKILRRVLKQTLKDHEASTPKVKI